MRHRPVLILQFFIVLLAGHGFVDAKQIYLAGHDIWRADLDGSDIQQLMPSEAIQGMMGPQGIAVDADAGKVYWTRHYRGIRRANTDGTEVEDVLARGENPEETVARDPHPVALDVETGTMYWGEGSGGRIMRSTLEGGSPEVLVDVGSWVSGLALDLNAGKLYWAESAAGTLSRSNLDGTHVEMVTDAMVSGQDPAQEPGQIALDVTAQAVYWTTTGNIHSIRRSDFDGTNVEDVRTVSQPGSIGGIALDPGRGDLYWSEVGNVYRANLDGTDSQILLSCNDYIEAIALDLSDVHLLAGDADADFDFDQLDLVQVQIAGKYLTGEPATWGEGDWNGAPGGTPGNAPDGDGVFNQADIIAAQQAGVYLTGPYAGVQTNPLVPVPEPNSLLLLAAGILALALGRHRVATVG